MSRPIHLMVEYHDEPQVVAVRVKNPMQPTSRQEELIAFVNNPENIRKAAEGSMEKRRKVMTQPNIDTQTGMTFSDVVALIRKFYSEDNLGYAKAAEILDKAIEPQVAHQVRQASIDARRAALEEARDCFNPLSNAYGVIDGIIIADEVRAELKALKENKQ